MHRFSLIDFIFSHDCTCMTDIPDVRFMHLTVYDFFTSRPNAKNAVS